MIRCRKNQFFYLCSHNKEKWIEFFSASNHFSPGFFPVILDQVFCFYTFFKTLPRIHFYLPAAIELEIIPYFLH